MNCHEFADLMDRWMLSDEADALAGEERSRVEQHAVECTDCCAALLACRTLAADHVSVSELSMDSASPLQESLSIAPAAAAGTPLIRRRFSMPLVIGGLAAGTAVLATTGWIGYELASKREAPNAAESADTDALRSGSNGASADFNIGVDAGAGPLPLILEAVSAAEQRAHETFAAERLNQSQLPDGDYFALLRIMPRYPEEAASRGITGAAIVEFTINEIGDIEDPVIVESTDQTFEATTIEAIRQFKYKPRVVAGQAEAVAGVRNIFRYELESAQNTAAADSEGAGTASATTEAEHLDEREFRRLLGPAYECLGSNDLLCVELELDALRAIHSLSPRQLSDLWHIYGFVHHRRGRLLLAIEAYRNAADPTDDTGEWMRARSLQVVAQIHYELRQYQEALDVMIEYLKMTPNAMMHDYVFVDELRALGAQLR
jgi:TonB family protein